MVRAEERQCEGESGDANAALTAKDRTDLLLRGLVQAVIVASVTAPHKTRCSGFGEVCLCVHRTNLVSG